MGLLAYPLSDEAKPRVMDLDCKQFVRDRGR
jgi:hypothetical protein